MARKAWLDAAADFSGYNFGGQPQGVSGHLLTYTIGPRVRFPHEWRHWTPFGQVLAGGARVGGTLSGQSAGENGFALMLGGGADFRINAHLAARVFDVEYLMTRFDRVTNTPGIQNDFCASRLALSYTLATVQRRSGLFFNIPVISLSSNQTIWTFLPRTGGLAHLRSELLEPSSFLFWHRNQSKNN